MNEEWRAVVGWEGLYEVSSLGNVRSLDRVVFRSDGRPRPFRGQVLSLFPLPSGYLFVNLKDSGRDKLSRVHRLVAEAFLPNPNSLPSVLHWDDDRSNNTVTNLRWGTDSDNKVDRLRNGRNPNANKTFCKHGHEFTQENTYIRPDGWRDCKACAKERRLARKVKEGE